MAATEESTVELTPEQKIEAMLQPAEQEPPEDVEAAAEETQEVEEPVEDEAELEAEADAVEEDVDPGIEMHDVEIDGQVYEVPPAIRDRLEQAEDYTQKTQGLSADRKALEVVRDELQQNQQQYEFLDSISAETERSQTINWQIGELRQYMRENIDTLTGNQLEKVRFQIDELSTEKDGIVQALRTKYGEFQQAAEQARQELRDKSTETLKSRLPNWGDEAQSQADAYGREIGFTDEELAAAIDPRERQVLWEASEYRRIKAGAGQARRKARKAPKIQPKGRASQSEQTKRKISIRKRLDDAGGDQKAKAKIIQEDIGRRLGL